VAGGGELAARKIAGLLEAGAGVTVVSFKVIDAIQRYANGGEPGFLSRPYGVESAWKGLESEGEISDGDPIR
jgi:siroheme synthase (precorrin-2 oxidase/ferrochelatase)